MRLRPSNLVALCVFVVGLGAAGCSPSQSSTTAPASTSSTESASTGITASAGTSSTAPTGQAQAASSGSLCQPADLSLTLGAKIAATASTQPIQVVDLTNKGSSACTMEGFPGVNLVGVADGKQDYTWPLTRASASYASQTRQGIAKVTLQPGGTAHFDIRYLPGVAGNGNRLITVDKIVITPPNDYTQGEMTWHQVVDLQDAATHPGTYIMPVVAGS